MNHNKTGKLKCRMDCSRMQLYLRVAAVTVIMLFLMFISLDMYPFGNRTLIYADGDQYFGFFGYLQSVFFTDNDLLFSWSNVLGGNMAGTFAYYCASPFNLIAVFFKNNLLAGYHFIFGVKFVAAALCFAFMLKSLFAEADEKAIVLFSASYPFMGYMAQYAWNQSWMDGVIILPVMLLGIWKLINQRKSLLYILSLAFILFSNYYIGFMLCITSVLFFLCGMVLSYSGFRKDMIRICARYAASSLTAAALSAVLLLPAFFGLPAGRGKSLMELWGSMDYLCKPVDVLSMMYTYPLKNVHDSVNDPVVYVGIAQFVLVVLFFLNREIPKKYKAVCGGLLAFFLLSFSNSALNTIWHGFSANVWFNYRYSFIVSFILELAAFYSFLHAREARGNLLACGAVMGVITAIIVNASKENVSAKTLLLDVFLICATLIILYLYTGKYVKFEKRWQLLCIALMMAVTFGNLMENSYLTLRNRLGKVKSYTKAMDIERGAREIIDDDGFYRRGSTFRYGRCYAMLADFAGVQNFASTENIWALGMCGMLGIEHAGMWCLYDRNVSLATDTLLGIKYVLSPPGYKSEYYTTEGEISNRNLVVYKNENALPILFPAEKYFESGQNAYNKFEYINHCWNSISSKGGDIFCKLDTVKKDTPTTSGRDIHIEFTAKNNDPVYAYVPTGDISVDVEAYSKYQDMFYVGKYQPGERGELVIHADASYAVDDDIVLYSESPDILNQKASNARKNIMIEKKSSSHLSFVYEAGKNEIVSSTIPFENSWHVYIDGKETETSCNMGAFLAFDCPEGKHEIELRYWPRRFRMGAAISAVTALALIMAGVIRMKMRKGIKK